MKVPLSWLKEYVDVSVSPNELAERLLNIGFETEEILDLGEGLDGVVAGRVTEVSAHPKNPKLQILTVDVGRKKSAAIVTAAKNAAVGESVPVALSGSVLKDGKKIAPCDFAGTVSEGMLLSLAELAPPLGLLDETPADKGGIFHLPPETVPGTTAKKALGLDDCVLDISITANRPDCQSICGIAREVGAALGVPVRVPEIGYGKKPAKAKIPAVRILDKSACERYTGTLIEDIKIQASPEWMQRRLKMSGIRPINNVVDITNYVLLEIGQPMHAFDIRHIDGCIEVRHAKKGEEIVALDGNRYALSETMAVIADNTKPVAIAGVMGGEYSGIEPDTDTVFLEVARFFKGSVRLTSRTLGLRSDSSARYEKGVDLFSVEQGRRRALHLIERLGAGHVTELSVEDGVRENPSRVIKTTPAAINRLLGIEVPKREMSRILSALGFLVTGGEEALVCTVPPYREDVDNYTDLAEEIIRFYGYDKLTPTYMETVRPTEGGMNAAQKSLQKLKELLVAYGCREVLTYAFIHPDAKEKLGLSGRSVTLRNPLSAEQSEMRTQLLSSVLTAAGFNQNRKNGEFRLFELARVYLPDALPLTALPVERERLCLAFAGKNEDFYTLKEVVTAVFSSFSLPLCIAPTKAPYLHPGMGADILRGEETIGSFGKLHPACAAAFGAGENLFVAEIDLQPLLSLPSPVVKYVPLPKFPAVSRDLAIVVDEPTTVGLLKMTIGQTAGSLLEEVRLFDVYRGGQIAAGKKSVAFSLRFRSAERTLTDEEIAAIMERVMKKLESVYAASLR
ncbi:MAG: phenylalanine--tRNA ligase subunit beta [Clostridiales bacterium]|jgi:phenylalanyl-tRNA synthetase beta chain|nr:phenylalanine--tRNA ligase subunit beta [Clostridiales bacterium]